MHCPIFHGILKVSKSRKQILKFSFEPKNRIKYFCISALASTKRSNQKNKGTLLLSGGLYFDSLKLRLRRDLVLVG